MPESKLAAPGAEIPFTVTPAAPVNEAQYLLKVGRRARLTPRDSRDAVILHCIIKHMSLIDANLTLNEAGEETL